MFKFRKSETRTETQKSIGELERRDRFEYAGTYVEVQSINWTHLNKVTCLLRPVASLCSLDHDIYVTLDANSPVTVWR